MTRRKLINRLRDEYCEIILILNALLTGASNMMTKIENDFACLDLLREGKTEAYHYLIRVYFPVLKNYAAKILDDTAVIEDIVDDVFIKVWFNREKFNDFVEIKKFLYTSVRNACLNHLRNIQREKVKHNVFSEVYVNTEVEEGEELIQSELFAEIRKAIENLPEKMREVFIMAYLEKIDNYKIAETLNLSYQTVRNQKTKALTLIRKSLKHSVTTIQVLMIVRMLK
jgi:RNA polymerase sigma-70 factor (family 1)